MKLISIALVIAACVLGWLAFFGGPSGATFCTPETPQFCEPTTTTTTTLPEPPTTTTTVVPPVPVDPCEAAASCDHEEAPPATPVVAQPHFTG